MLFVPCISRLCYCKVETSVVSVMSIPLTVIHFPLTFQICEFFFFFFFLQFHCTVTMSDYGSLSICPAWYTLYFLGLWVYAFLQF